MQTLSVAAIGDHIDRGSQTQSCRVDRELRDEPFRRANNNMGNSPRAAALDELAWLIAAIESPRPIRIAIDGRTASGKTTLADELAGVLNAKGREVIRTSIDGFHRPRVGRYARGRHSAEGYRCAPASAADAIFNNDDCAGPILKIRNAGRSSQDS